MIVLQFLGKEHRAVATRADGRLLLYVDGAPVDVRPAGPAAYSVNVDGRPRQAHAVVRGDTIHVHLNGRAWQVERVDPTRSERAGGAAGEGAVTAPMPGMVVAALVALGQQVRRGDPLLVIESMKLQATITADVDGAVADLPFAVGCTFQRGAVLALIEEIEQ